MKFFFTKAHGAGNDFIIIDDRQPHFPFQNSSLIAELCHRRLGIGADGLILLQTSTNADYRMRFFNADGGEVAICGNGLRCLVAFIEKLGEKKSLLKIETGAGVISCKKEKDRISTQFSEPELLRKLVLKNREAFFVHAGVPHVVLLSENVEQEDVETLGREIRHHPEFFPQGTNVSFLSVQEESHIRTFERGVEGETLACSTGILAAAKVLSTLTNTEHVTIFPRSKDSIEVNTLTWELTGPAVLVFDGVTTRS